ncbi:MAG TPA: hypothetical protein VHD69_01030 [Candidatus Paceibacterota bacterium]|nr:hypothetical protein [Candidatus Paceibacterota bacterium]
MDIVISVRADQRGSDETGDSQENGPDGAARVALLRALDRAVEGKDEMKDDEEDREQNASELRGGGRM